MSHCAPAHNEAGPSSGSSRYEPAVRRSKTVSYSKHTSAATSLHQLALPIQLNATTGRPGSSSLGELRDPAVSPSKRGETLRAYSRQRRVFNDNGAPTSPEQLTRALPSASPASPSMRRPHPSRNFNSVVGSSESIGSSLLFSNGTDDADTVGFNSMPIHSLVESLADEASSSFSSTPSLTSPTSTLSRSTSLRSAGSERNTLMGGTRYLSLNGSADLPTTMEGLSPDYGASNWTRRARRWSNSMSRRMSITALNHTIHSTTSPYLKAGLQELRSIFDVDTLGVAVDDQDADDKDDLEEASSIHRLVLQPDEQHRLGLFAPSAVAASRDQAVFESPDTISPILSRQSSSEDRELPTPMPSSRPSISFKSQIYEAPVAHRRAQSWRKHRSLSISDLPNRSLLVPAIKETSSHPEKSSSPTQSFSIPRDGSARSQSVRTPLVAVGLAALSMTIVGVCALETSIHPDAASLPLTAFMLAQSVFALVGISGLVLQRRWVIDLASRLIRAHVLCQVLIALAALRSLSRTAFYRDRVERQTFNGTAAAGVLTSPRFLSSSGHVDPHMSTVGSFRDQVTYICVFIVQAALPLALVFWAQYTIASALSRATRHLPAAVSSSKEIHEQQHQQSVPTVKAANAEVSGAPRNERTRHNSENPTMSKFSSRTKLGGPAERSEGWLGFMITRFDVNATVSAPPKFELDAEELTSRLQALARAQTPTQRSS